jgi:hypothetical protein
MGGGMGGRTTTVANPPCETIFVANLSPNTTEEELIEARHPPLSRLSRACVYTCGVFMRVRTVQEDRETAVVIHGRLSVWEET